MAQQVNPMFYREIQLERKKTYTLQSITREIQQQTGISFSYNAARISPSTKIRMKGDRITVEQLLASIRKKTGINYKIISQTHIIYTESGKRKTARAKARNKKEPTAVAAIHNTPEMILRPLGTDSIAGQQIVIIGDSAVAGYYFSGGVSSGGGYGGNTLTRYAIMIDVTEDEEMEDTYEHNLSRNTSKGYVNGKTEALAFIKNSVLLGVGISADEIYYLNPTARLGFDFLYGTVSYNIGSFPHWRYGIGASAKINDRFRLHGGINTGQSISQNYNAPTFDTIPQPQPPDTVLPPIIVETTTPLVVRSKLTRISVFAEWDLGRGFSLGGGLTWNRLKTDYSNNGVPVALSNILPIGYDADERFRTIKPPYLLGNTYSGNQSSNIKTWIGLQLSFIYRFSFFR